MAEDRLLTLQEVASRLQVPVRTVYRWRYSGDGPTGLRVGRHVRVRESELERWLDTRQDAHPA